ncbi:MAG: exosortase/archaeosortase family protein [Candidatus Acidiferrales bacterium]
MISKTNRVLGSAAARALRTRHYAFGPFVALSAAVFWRPLLALWHAALSFDFCSQVLIVPFVVVFLVAVRRTEVFREAGSSYVLGAAVSGIALGICWFARNDAATLGAYDGVSLSTFGIVLLWAAGFCGIYGRKAARAGAFPLGFLLLAVPIPQWLLDRFVFGLQDGSTAIARRLFEIVGVPVMRHGFDLYLPGLTIEVAKECSSIRSSIALVITCLLAGYLFLRSRWKRLALVLVAIPLSVFKNAIRIVTLSLLSIYVNPEFMTSDLHRDGGILFYLLALAILFPLFRWFERLERREALGKAMRPSGPNKDDSMHELAV